VLTTFQGEGYVRLSLVDSYRECSLGPRNRTSVTYFQAEKLELPKFPEHPAVPWAKRKTLAIADSISCPALGRSLKALQPLITTIAPPEFNMRQGRVAKRSSQQSQERFVSVHPSNAEVWIRDVPTKTSEVAEVVLRGKLGDENFHWAEALDDALKPCWGDPHVSHIPA
jgi:hypothetical protein